MANILIADDDDDFRLVFADGLATFGHKVRGVPNGTEAVAALEEGHFHVVFLDVLMREGGAITTLHAMRNVDAEIPINVITGRIELIDSPLFVDGLRAATAIVPKTKTLAELNHLILSQL